MINKNERKPSSEVCMQTIRETMSLVPARDPHGPSITGQAHRRRVAMYATLKYNIADKSTEQKYATQTDRQTHTHTYDILVTWLKWPSHRISWLVRRPTYVGMNHIVRIITRKYYTQNHRVRQTLTNDGHRNLTKMHRKQRSTCLYTAVGPVAYMITIIYTSIHDYSQQPVYVVCGWMDG